MIYTVSNVVVYNKQIKGMSMELDKMKSTKGKLQCCLFVIVYYNVIDQPNLTTENVDTNDDKFMILKEENESLSEMTEQLFKSKEEPSNVKDQSIQFNYMIPVNG